MSISRCIVTVLTAVSSHVHGADGFLFLTNDVPFETVFVTPTNVMMTFRSGHYIIKHPDDRIPELSIRFSSDLIENNETLVLIPEQRLEIYTEYEESISFVPVALKGQRKGFRFTKAFAPDTHGYETPPKITRYIVLSDVPVEAGEEDVEGEIPPPSWPDPAIQALIERHGEKKAMEIIAFAKENYEKSLAENKAQEEVGDGGASPPRRLWLYAVIALCVLPPVLYLLRRKLKTGN
jgi:hypothetical protein